MRDVIYARLSGESPFFDSRIAYIAETGPKDHRMKRWPSWTAMAPTTASSPRARPWR
jgi:hypothetical protein